ncbi:MAG: PAS domain S-box protein, partial [Acidobacteria bacterium]|nr:PAS domain S-box protein [Acidobacteriota bacterium]
PSIHVGVNVKFDGEKSKVELIKELNELRQFYHNRDYDQTMDIECLKAFDILPDSILILDKDLVLRYCNQSAADFFHYKKQDIINRKYYEVVTDSIEYLEDFIDEVIKTPQSYSFHRYNEDKDNWLEYNIYPVTDSMSGKIKYIVIMLRDATSLITREKEIVEKESLYRNIFENTGTATIVFGDDNILKMVNSEFAELSGYSREEIEGKMRWYDFVSDEDKVRMSKYHEQRSKGIGSPPTDYRFTFIDRDNNSIFTHVRITIIPETKDRVASLIDETEIIRTQVELEFIEQLSRLISKISTRFINLNPEEINEAIVDALEDIARLTDVNRAYVYLYNDDAGKKIFELSHYWAEADLTVITDEFKEFVSQLLKIEKPFLDVGEILNVPSSTYSADINIKNVEKLLKKNGISSIIFIPILFSGSLLGVIGFDSIRRKQRWASGVIPTLRMIGEIIANSLVRKKTMDILGFQTAIIDQSPDGFAITDIDGITHFVNESWAEMHKLKAADCIGKSLKIYHSKRQYENEIKQAVEEIKTKGFFNGVVGHVTSDGQEFPTRISCTLLRNSNGEPVGMGAIVRDITDEIEIQQRLTQAQRVDSIGHLAGGIAHDFNNLLSPIIAYSELLTLDLNEDDYRRKKLGYIRDAAERGRSLIKQLLAYSRKQLLEMRIVDLGIVVQDFQKIIRLSVKENIEINIQVEEGCTINADTSQIEQILMNLTVNAQDAMPQGGKISINISNIEMNEEECKNLPDLKPGPMVLMTFSDTGVGISSDIKKHIFEPFYTTKKIGKGTGLGLATVYGIVKQHNGYIEVHSESGKGTMFEIYFPRQQGTYEPDDTEIKSNINHRGDETILVVEDEESVRKLVHEIIQTHGYNVYSTSTAKEAEEYSRKHKDELDLLITDMIMPDVNGKELYKIISKIIPDLKVLYMSGYTHDIIADEGVLEEDINFLQKPISVNTLLEVIRSILDKK